MISFLGGKPALPVTLDRLRKQRVFRLGIPVILSSGPRYLQSFDQVYKGGPSKGLFLILTGEPVEDIAIPGAGYTFRQLQLALALGDFDSLESGPKTGRPLAYHAGLGARCGRGRAGHSASSGKHPHQRLVK